MSTSIQSKDWVGKILRRSDQSKWVPPWRDRGRSSLQRLLFARIQDTHKCPRVIRSGTVSEREGVKCL